MSRPTFRHDDGAGPIAPKHNAVAWSDYVKPSIEYDIQPAPGMFGKGFTESLVTAEKQEIVE